MSSKNDDLCRVCGQETLEDVVVIIANVLEVVHRLNKVFSESFAHVVFQCFEPFVDFGRGLEVDRLPEHDLLSFLGRQAANVGLFVHDKTRNTSKHLPEMLLDSQRVIGIADDLQQVFVTDKVEARECHPLLLEVLTQRLLDLVQQICKAFKRPLDIGNVEHLEDLRRAVDLLQH